MKILFCSYLFAPGIGGVETVGRLLVKEFEAAGHEVRVVTNTAGASANNILRCPSVSELCAAVHWADVVFHNNISLRSAAPLFILPRPWIVTHHTWLRRPDGSRAFPDFLKEVSLRRANNIAVSAALAAELPVKSRVLPNPYDAEAFHVRRDITRNRDLIFVGRLVSDKGGDVLLEAIAQLHRAGLNCNLTVVGDGPERGNLQSMAQRAGLEGTIEFLGSKSGADLGALLNQHRVMVVPSRWNEPFGLVALEGIACGCAVIGTSGGGLPAAIGLCGSTVPNGDASALAKEIQRVLCDPSGLVTYQRKAESHLKQHHPATVGQQYLELFEELRG